MQSVQTSISSVPFAKKVSKLHRIEHNKRVLDNIAHKLNIKYPSDWGKVTIRDIRKFGGSSLLNQNNGSIFTCLQSTFRDVDWKRDWFIKPKEYWKSMENRKFFLDELAVKLNIKNPSDWGKIKTRTIQELGGISLLENYNGSLFACLQSVYKDIEWKTKWFSKVPNSYWKSKKNGRKFLDEIAIQLNIETPSDWGKVTLTQFKKLGGSSILYYYNNSLYFCLISIYKEIEWKRGWFSNAPRFPKSHWDSIENCRAFMDGIAHQSNITTSIDWKKVSISLVKNNGGAGLLRKYEGSLKSVLRELYSFVNWNHENLPSEKHLQSLIKGIFPSDKVILNHRNQRI